MQIVWKQNTWTDLRVSSLQFGLSSPTDNSFTSESCSMLWDRSSSLRWDGLDFRAEAREQQISDTLQKATLYRE